MDPYSGCKDVERAMLIPEVCVCVCVCVCAEALLELPCQTTTVIRGFKVNFFVVIGFAQMERSPSAEGALPVGYCP